MLITCTGWTWDYVDQHVTLPQAQALNKCWVVLPPAAIALRRICGALGMKTAADKPRARTVEEAVREAMAGGLPVIQGRPNDPMLDFLDLPPRT